MSTLISMATGNWTAAGTWNLADATSELDSEAGSTATTTSFVASANFTPGAITTDAVAVKFASRSASPTGTFTVELFNSTGALSVAQVVVNISDLPLSGGWVVFPIGSTLLIAATNYQVRVKSSTSGQATVYRNATAGNWSRQLRTTTTQAPVAGDKLIVAGEHTGAGTGNDFTVTMDETAATIYGAVAFPQSVTVNKRAILRYGTTAATNYYLKMKGKLKVFSNGEFNIGTTGTPMPATSSAKLEFDSTAAVDSGLEIGSEGIYTAQGNALTYDRAYLAANAAVAATALTTDVSTGWLSGDEVAFAPTERTVAQYEKRTLSANAVGTAFSVTAGLTYAHDGTTFAKGEVINLTRNVKVYGASSTLTGFISVAATASVDIDWAQHYFLGNATAATSAFAVSTTTGGSFNLQNSSIHDCTIATTSMIRVLSTVPTGITISNNVFYNSSYICVYFSGTGNTPGTITLDNNWLIAGQYGLYFVNASGVVTDNRLSGFTASGILYSGAYYGPFGTFSDNVAHANATGIFFTSVNDGTASNITAFRNTSFGFEANSCTRMTFGTADIKGNTTGNVRLTSNVDCVFNAFTLNGEASYVTSYGMYIGGYNVNSVMYNSTFGSTQAHNAADLVPTGQTSNMIFHKTVFSSSTEYGLSINRPGALYQSQDHQNTVGNNKIVKYEGVISRDNTIFNSASPSIRMAPAVSNIKLISPSFTTAVASGNTVTVSVAVRKSVVGDGTAYNGNQPRLIVKANPAAGITADTVLDTMSVAAGSWETLSGVTAAVTENTRLEFVIDCDGTAGWVNADDAAVLTETTTNFTYWADGSAYVVGTPSSSTTGGAFTFVS